MDKEVETTYSNSPQFRVGTTKITMGHNHSRHPATLFNNTSQQREELIGHQIALIECLTFITHLLESYKGDHSDTARYNTALLQGMLAGDNLRLQEVLETIERYKHQENSQGNPSVL